MERISNRVPAWVLAVTAMLSVQVGASISISLFDEIGVAGTAWLRMSIAAAILVLLHARKLQSLISHPHRTSALKLGLVSSIMTITFLGSLAHIPLGTAVAIEFLGPLTVAAIHAHNRRALIWPFIAFGGVLMLTQPWRGETSLVGVGLALIAAVGWALYIVMTHKVGDVFSGLEGLAISIPTAALLLTPFGAPAVFSGFSSHVIIVGFAAAVLLPLIPWVLELLALRRLSKHVFGTLMALEPAIALVVGLILLSQLPEISSLIGIAAVVLAGIGAERTSPN